MAKIIAVTNQKGGVGKTTSCINLGAELAKKYKTLVLDLDHQADATKVLSGDTYDFEMTVADLFSNKRVTVEKSVLQAKSGDEPIKNLYFIPSHITLSRVIEQTLTRSHREKILQKHLSSIKNDYDYILIDCPPNLSVGVTNAMMVADLFLIPIDGGKFSLDGLSDLLDAIEEVKETSGFNFAVFRNEYAPQNKLMNEFLDEQMKVIKDSVLPAKVRRAEAIGQASVTAQPLWFYDKKSPAVKDYQSLAKQVIKRVNK